MLINITSYGRLGNRLQLFAHLIAFCIENDVKIINLGFQEYAEFFANTENDLLCRFPPRTLPITSPSTRNFFYKLANYIVRKNYLSKFPASYISTIYSHPFTNDNNEFRLDNEEFLQSIKDTKIIVSKGYFFADYLNLLKHAEKIRQYFRPCPKYEKNVEDITNVARQNSDILIGIHIRRGDYKNFEGGKFYYDNAVFVRLMEQLTNLFNDKKISFLMCSDEPPNSHEFSSFNITSGSNHIIEDMYALAECDYIIGTPSTYSRWASFYGNTPAYHVLDPNLDISLSSFKTYDEIVHHHMQTAPRFPRD